MKVFLRYPKGKHHSKHHSTQIATHYQATLSHIQVKVQFKIDSMLSCWDSQRDDEVLCAFFLANS